MILEFTISPKKSKLSNNVGINADIVAKYKYISRKGQINGFYSGNTFANQIGISTQVPNKIGNMPYIIEFDG